MTEQEQIFAYKELRNNGQAFFIDTYEDADRIIEALEKQIPKKPILVTRSDGIIKFYPCPSCSTSEKYVSVYPSMKYCPNCGQALKWE